MNKKALMPVLVVFPLLFMANSAMHYYIKTVSYTDYQINSITYGEIFEYRYKCEYVIENTGQSFMDLTTFNPHLKANEVTRYDGSIELCIPTKMFLGPGQTITLNGYSAGMYELEELEVDVKACKLGNEVSFGDCSYIEERKQRLRDSTGTMMYGYCFNFENLSVQEKNDYYYSIMVEYEYNGATYYQLDYSGQETFLIYRLEDIENPADSIHIKKCFVTLGSQKSNFDFKGLFKVFGTILLYMFIVLVVGLSLVAFVLAFFLVPIIILCKKPWCKRKQDGENGK